MVKYGFATLLLAAFVTSSNILENICRYAITNGAAGSLAGDTFEAYWNVAQCTFSYIAAFLVQRALAVY